VISLCRQTSMKTSRHRETCSGFLVTERWNSKQAFKIFIRSRSNHQEITEAGEKALLRIYKGKSNKKDLKDVQVRAYTMRVASANDFVKA